jgi:hypothetical protein
MALFLLTLFFGATALWFARRVYTEIRAGRDWPTVPGTILERGIGEPMKAHGRMFLPHVKYTYSVAGAVHTNDQVYQVRNSGGYPTRIRKLVDSLPNPVPVHYDPTDPSRSYLVANPTSIVWILVIFGVGAILFAPVHLVS